MNMSTNRPSRIAPFLVGLVLGIIAAVFLPSYVRPYIPQWLSGRMNVVKGTVAAKQKKADVLLLTVNTPEGVLLATFKKKVDEINLLINDRDSIEFNLPKYLPFIEDPKIIRVVKEEQSVSDAVPELEPVEKTKEQSEREVKPGRQKMPPTAAPATAPTATAMNPALVTAPVSTMNKSRKLDMQ